MRFVLTLLLALLLLTVESVAVKYLGFEVTRIDVTVAMIAFLALRASVMEGAVSAFAVGYLLDLMTGHPTGLYTFLGVLVMLLGRVGNNLLDVRTAPSFAAFALGMDVLHSLLAIAFTWLTRRGEGGVGFSFGAFVLQAALTGAAAYLLYPLLKRIDPGAERPQVGVLR